jgi:hypothetical protein
MALRNSENGKIASWLEHVPPKRLRAGRVEIAYFTFPEFGGGVSPSGGLQSCSRWPGRLYPACWW